MRYFTRVESKVPLTDHDFYSILSVAAILERPLREFIDYPYDEKKTFFNMLPDTLQEKLLERTIPREELQRILRDKMFRLILTRSLPYDD